MKYFLATQPVGCYLLGAAKAAIEEGDFSLPRSAATKNHPLYRPLV
ncbi:MAG: hypothetical protein JXA33_26085 [Anaerolineae bacterium]|nr:hypothetical protein [Anaerolineae bacterium]